MPSTCSPEDLHEILGLGEFDYVSDHIETHKGIVWSRIHNNVQKEILLRKNISLCYPIAYFFPL